METCDAIIVGGGPAGAACATKLRQSGLDVVVVDRAAFPRDKVCAGWITPQILDELPFDLNEYRQSRTFQPIHGFRVGLIGRQPSEYVEYGRAVSYGIRRCEFDTFLLRRSGARLRLGAPASRIRRSGAAWAVDDAIKAPMIVGAGGHFCPIARLLNRPERAAESARRHSASGQVVAAQEVELPLDAEAAARCRVISEVPELYFCEDLQGYGWCFRKGAFLNVGFGRVDARALPQATEAFVNFLRGAGRLARLPNGGRWRGHAYRLAGSPNRLVAGDGVVLVGDAAGIAYAQSGEGIRPAIESGLMAAAVIVAARGNYRRHQFAPYATWLRERFGPNRATRWLSHALPSWLAVACGRWLLGQHWFVRDVVIDRWFLHARAPALTSSEISSMNHAA